MSKKLALQVSRGFLIVFCKGFYKVACTLREY